ncbi:MAG: type II secretion system F family protein [Proteobacteria bacterium]|nr:type II secretion system F family protein [Pseudomonadota bacterium]
MDIFEYKGRNKRGEIMQGTIQSPNPAAVAAWMIESGISPIQIRQQTDKLKGQPQWLLALQGAGTVKPADLLLFTRQMGTLAKAGIPMMQALAGMLKATANPALTEVIQDIRAHLDKGAELSAAMARHPKVFDSYYVSMVRVGEGTGKLEEIFKSLYEQLAFEKDMRQKVKAALRYPTFVMIAIAIAIAIVSLFVIPSFAKTYAKMHASLPFLTLLLLGISEFAVRYWWAVLSMLAGAVYAFRSFVRLPEGRYFWDRLKLRLPVVGRIIKKATIARFCRSFATASKSGLPIVQAFTLVSRVLDNAYFEERILLMREGVQRGESMLRVAQTAGIFAPLELQMIAVGEESGEIDSMLMEVGEMYQEEVEYEVSRVAESVEPILLGCIGAMVLVLMLGIFMPLWDLGSVAMRKH